MKKKNSTLTLGLLATSIALASGAQAEIDNVRINGFASIVAGQTFNEGLNKRTGKDTTFTADEPNDGTYDGDIAFTPDSMYGLQITADLGEGLSLTGQITGAGGANYDAEVSWAYLNYQLNENWKVLAGRQRLPLFFYSDYSDVAYAYHWIRIPVEVNVPVDTLDGVQLTYEGNLGDWDTRFQVYGGSSESTSEIFGDFGTKDSLGVVFYGSNDWLQLRATYLTTNFYAGALESFGQGKNDAVAVDFIGLAAHMTFGNAFVVTEVTQSSFDKPLVGAGNDDQVAGYISTGYRFDKLTPHITYSFKEEDLIEGFNTDVDGAPILFGDATRKSDSITVGLRYDFHPKAALKAEYLTRTDDSDKVITDISGDKGDVDLFTVGIDLIF